MSGIVLPVPVMQGPHWRVRFLPDSYERERIGSVSECRELIRKHRVTLRGWDYPHLSTHSERIKTGPNWLASWADFDEQYEYWRFYQSTQFIHLSSIWEQSRHRTLMEEWASFQFGPQRDWSKEPGYLSVINVVYRMSEIYEFAARLSTARVYDGELEISISLNDIDGYLLLVEPGRHLSLEYRATVPVLENSRVHKADDLRINSSGLALEAIQWFFERFQWFDPPTQVFKTEQERFLSRQV